jgi:hypothetical protein
MHLRPNPDVVAQRMGDQIVLVHLATNRIYDLNVTAARLWELLTSGHSLGEAQAQLLQEFEVEPEALAREIESAVRLMLERQLVTVRDGD